MAVTARIMAVVYALAITLAVLAQHCEAMFGAPATAAAAMAAHHGGAHHGHDAPAKPPKPDCAAMALAKAIGATPSSPVLAAPDIFVMAVAPAEPILAAAPVRTRAAAPRGPPRGGGGFAAVYARNHRLLI